LLTSAFPQRERERSRDVCNSCPTTRLVLGQLYTCTLPPVHRGGGASALCTVCLLILSRGQAAEAPPRYTAEGGLTTAEGGLTTAEEGLPCRRCHVNPQWSRDGLVQLAKIAALRLFLETMPIYKAVATGNRNNEMYRNGMFKLEIILHRHNARLKPKKLSSF
jgi:hypothetical protein